MNRKYIRPAFMLALVVTIVLTGSITASASLKPRDPYMWDENYYFHHYYNWNSTRVSYLVPVDGGYMRVQVGCIYAEKLADNPGTELIGVEYYDNGFNRIGKTYRIIDTELPFWGGFAEHDGYYYIVTGQSNPKESDDVEVIRVTKYDSNWKRIGSASMYGANTYNTFSFGTLDIAWSGDTMIVHTCHQMYKLADGLNHQTNFSFYVDVNKMDELKEAGFAYASHSFSQQVRTEGRIAVTADHGDSGPRGIRLALNDLDTGDKDTAMIIEAAQRDNYRETGMTLGGLQISDTSYLVAGASADQEKGGTGVHNIFVGAVNKKDLSVELRWLTDYSEDGKAGATNPYLLKLGSDRFLLMWNDIFNSGKNAEKKASLKCVYLNGEGEAVSEIYSLKGILSDCEPIISDGKIVWYSYKAPKMLFYTMPVSDPSQLTYKMFKWKKPSHIRLKKSRASIKQSKYAWTVWAFNDTLKYDCPDKLLRFSGKGLNRKSRKVLKINKKTGYIKVKAGTRIGTYKMKVTVKSIGSKTYLPDKKSAIVTIKVKKKISDPMM